MIFLYPNGKFEKTSELKIEKRAAKFRRHGYAMKDHIHLCLSIPPKYAVSAAIGLLKGKSASEVMSFGSRSNKMVRGRQFWARGYCVSTVGLDEQTIREYIRNQEAEDKRIDQLEFTIS